MIYGDLKSSYDIKNIINTIKKEFRNLSQLTFPVSYETTMGQKTVLTIFQNLQPVMKVEGPKDLLDVLKEVLEEEKAKFYSKS
ncbi:MAG: hypothetical protein J7L71_02535 [Spirochaetaceae bacterium]|nr:hypothetical protein [Spirochaetaceae bacterium]